MSATQKATRLESHTATTVFSRKAPLNLGAANAKSGFILEGCMELQRRNVSLTDLDFCAITFRFEFFFLFLCWETLSICPSRALFALLLFGFIFFTVCFLIFHALYISYLFSCFFLYLFSCIYFLLIIFSEYIIKTGFQSSFLLVVLFLIFLFFKFSGFCCLALVVSFCFVTRAFWAALSLCSLLFLCIDFIGFSYDIFFFV